MQTALILEDNPEALHLLEEIVASSFDGIKTSTARNIETCKKLLENLDPDIALIDMGLPDGSGLEIIKQLKAKNENAYVVVTTIFDDSSTLFSALRAGVDGYILKYQTKDMIVELLKGITEGRPPLSPTIAKKILLFFNPEQKPNNEMEDELSLREKEVLQLIAKGFSVMKTSELLGISKNTTAYHIKAIYRKLKINSRAEATIEAARLGIIALDNN
jgi:DNA-binding NarL/FixJ family response regulator